MRIYFFILAVVLPLSVAYGQFDPSKFTYDSVVTFSAGNYRAGPVKSMFFGSQWRSIWSKPVTAPVFNIRKAGYKVVKKGGGRETINLRLVDSAGNEYVLRSIDKKTTNALDPVFRNTIIADVVQDLTSSNHPYGAFIIAPMAEAAGIYHCKPFLVYVPYDTLFGEFAKVLANKPALFEQRADDDQSHIDHFGNAGKVIGTEKMFEKVLDDHDNRIDEQLYIRSRLFDFMIGDWGRHEDQWRWARFQESGNNLYKPIPRDRDHAFYKFNGLLPKVAAGAWGLRSLQDYSAKIKDLKGLTFSARALDRRVVTSLTKEDFINEALVIKQNISDEVIEESVGLLPINVFKSGGEELISKLKSRRDLLPEVAARYYDLLAEEISIVGSDKRELFIVERFNPDSTIISGIKLSGKGVEKEQFYKRVFNADETDEVVLFGLGGDDVFKINGAVESGIKIRIVGGEGSDLIEDNSIVKKGSKKTLIYDTKEYNTVVFHKESKDFRSSKPRDSVNVYSYQYDYDFTGPYLYPGFNTDDGVFIGAGILRKTYGFRKQPFESRQKLGLNYATQTGAFNFKFLGNYRSILRRTHLLIDARILGPQYVLNYFGYGNESVQSVEDIDFYRIRASRVYFNPSIYKEFSPRLVTGFGPEYDYFKLHRTENRFFNSPNAQIDTSAFLGNHFLGLNAFARFANVDSVFYPLNGYKVDVSMRAPYEVDGGGNLFISGKANISGFHTFSFLKPLTFAQRIGGEINLGAYYFYQAPSLGGTENLRGYRRNRFYGDRSLYSNTEARLRLYKFTNYLLTSNFGLLGFFDAGRVWAEGNDSRKWHMGYGPGLWLDLYEKILFSGTVGFSEDGCFVNIQYGFLF